MHILLLLIPNKTMKHIVSITTANSIEMQTPKRSRKRPSRYETSGESSIFFILLFRIANDSFYITSVVVISHFCMNKESTVPKKAKISDSITTTKTNEDSKYYVYRCIVLIVIRFVTRYALP